MAKIKIGIVGAGNCASSLIQGIEYYKSLGENHPDASLGLMHLRIGQYSVEDIEIAAVFDIDRRKVGKPLPEALGAAPNCTRALIGEFPAENGFPEVEMGRILDGISAHMADYPEDRRFESADRQPADVADVLKKAGVKILLNYLPVGSELAARFYAEEALKAGAGFINCIPVFIASDEAWVRRFRDAGLPIIGDDVKSQMGATIIHRTLARLFEEGESGWTGHTSST